MAHDTVKRALLFDFFGTLVNYEPSRSELVYPTTHARATEVGYRFDHGTFVADWDAASAELEAASSVTNEEFTMTDAARAFAEAAGLDLTAEVAHDLGASFVNEWRCHVRPVDGALQLVRELQHRYCLGIVSNTHDPDMVPSMLAEFGISECFDVVVLSVVHGRRKPHHSIYLNALDALRLPASSVMFVGDSFDADYQTPRQVGMDAFLITANDPRVPDRARLRSVAEFRYRLALDLT